MVNRILLLFCVFFLATGLTWNGTQADDYEIEQLEVVWSFSEGVLDCRGICTVESGSTLHIHMTLQKFYEGKGWMNIHQVSRHLNQSGQSETVLSASGWEADASYRVEVFAEAMNEQQKAVDSEVRYAYLSLPKIL